MPDMCYIFVFIFLSQFIHSNCVLTNKTDDVMELFLNFDDLNGNHYSKNNPCSLRLHSSLEKLRKRQTPVTSGFIDLSGYALHQTLRHAPFDMYVTDIRVRTPGAGNWARVEKCQFSNNENRLVAQLLFNDLSVTGNVRLFEENSLLKNPNHQTPAEFCSMTVRLKRAGLGLNAFPTRGRSKGIDVRTEARFVDPNFLSVHAHGCKLSKVFAKDQHGKSSDDDVPHVSHRYLETQIQQTNRLKHLLNDVKKNSHLLQEEAKPKSDDAEVRIITLYPNIPGNDNSASTLELYREDESDLNNYHKERILSAKFQNERDRLKAVLHVKNLIAQQANQVFQAHGPFSQFQISTVQRPIFEETGHEAHKPYNIKPVSVISTITELDENLSPVRPVQQGQQEFFLNDKIINQQQVFQAQTEVLSKEMEDMFLRGIKTLLTKYLEKQLEIPLKEALMTSIGYTVSYG